MTEYEYASLFAEYIQAANAAMTNLVTVVFAFLVASYLVADRLDRATTAVVLTIYTLFGLGYTNEVVQAYGDFARLGLVIQDRFADGLAPGLGWMGPATSPAVAFAAIPWAVGTMTGGSVLGSLWFFVHQRRKAGTGT